MHVINFTDSDLIPVVLHILQNSSTVAYNLTLNYTVIKVGNCPRLIL